jgi:hypothetical protein
MYPQPIHQWKKDKVSFLHLSANLLGSFGRNRQQAIRKRAQLKYLQDAEDYTFY